MPSAISASSSASVPDDTAIACSTPSSAASSRSSASTSGPMMKRWLSQTRVDRGEDLVAQRRVLRLQIEQRNASWHAAGHSTLSSRDLTAARVSRSASRRLIVSRLS